MVGWLMLVGLVLVMFCEENFLGDWSLCDTLLDA